MRTRIQSNGFTASAKQDFGRERGALASLIASAVLVLGTMIAATAVTVGIAHASPADSIIDHEGSLFAIALLLGLLFIGIGGITLLPRRGPRHRH